MTHYPTTELCTLKQLYRQESKKLYLAVLNGAPWEQLSVQRRLVDHLFHYLNAQAAAA